MKQHDYGSECANRQMAEKYLDALVRVRNIQNSNHKGPMVCGLMMIVSGLCGPVFDIDPIYALLSWGCILLWAGFENRHVAEQASKEAAYQKDLLDCPEYDIPEAFWWRLN